MDPQPGNNCRDLPAIYLIEPDVSARDHLRNILIRQGYATEIFASAEDFLASPGALRGCVVAEIDLPGLTGLALQEQLSRRSTQLPIIFMTSRACVSTAVRALRAGAVDFFVKPIVERSLLECIEDALGAAENVSDDDDGRPC